MSFSTAYAPFFPPLEQRLCLPWYFLVVWLNSAASLYINCAVIHRCIANNSKHFYTVACNLSWFSKIFQIFEIFQVWYSSLTVHTLLLVSKAFGLHSLPNLRSCFQLILFRLNFYGFFENRLGESNRCI